MRQSLKARVECVFGALLRELPPEHAEYPLDVAHFRNEIDRNVNAEMSIEFVQDRGEQFVRIYFSNHAGESFDVSYLTECWHRRGRETPICNVSRTRLI
jgi:hypothetical protein